MFAKIFENQTLHWCNILNADDAAVFKTANSTSFTIVISIRQQTHSDITHTFSNITFKIFMLQVRLYLPLCCTPIPKSLSLRNVTRFHNIIYLVCGFFERFPTRSESWSQVESPFLLRHHRAFSLPLHHHFFSFSFISSFFLYYLSFFNFKTNSLPLSR